MKKIIAFICIFFLTLSAQSMIPHAHEAEPITIIYEESSIERTQASFFLAEDAPNSYEMIRSALLTGETTGSFDPTEIDYLDVGSLIAQVVNKTPEIMYYRGGKIWSNGQIEYHYSIPVAQVQENQTLLQSEITNVLDSIIKPGFTDFDKVKAIHDYLALNTAYDYDNFLNETVPPDSYTAYGSLIEGIAVCDGYTKAAQILLDRLDIENEYVVGYGNGSLHSWNLVKLDSNYYFMDITWDDPVPNIPNYVRYNYFLVTSDQLRQDHTWEEANWPTATNKKYNYFNDFNSMIESDDFYYYSSQSDDLKLYKINKNGTNKQKISDAKVVSFAIHGDWIYFNDYSYGGYLFKMKTDDSALEQINSVHSTHITIENNSLVYLNNITNAQETVVLENLTPSPPVTLIGDPVASTKMWKVTFNKKFDFSSINDDVVTVKTEDGVPIQVSYDIDKTGQILFVYAPKDGYQKNTNYTLTIQNVKSATGQIQKTNLQSEKKFHVK